jgi:protein-disulfide isomerase
MGDVHRRWQASDPASFSRVQQQRYQGVKNALEGLVADALISEAAAKRSVTVEQLRAEIQSSAGVPTDHEIREIFERRVAPGQGLAFEHTAPAIAAYLRQQKANDAVQRFVEELRKATPPDLRIRFEPPRQKVTTSPDDPSSGAASAKVEIVEFSDFECPYCKQVAPTLGRVVSKYRDRVRLVWKDYPLPIHASARQAAEAARCAHELGRFWEYHDALFDHQDALGVASLRRYAVQLGLDGDVFTRCLETGTWRSRVTAGLEEGRRLGVSATPTVFINGRMITGAMPFETYEQIVLEELALAGEACGADFCPTRDRQEVVP